MPQPVRVVLTGTPDADVFQTAVEVAKELGVSLVDLRDMSDEEVSREIKRLNLGPDQPTVFVMSPERVPTMSDYSFFLCGLDAGPDINTKPFTDRYYPSGGRREAVMHLSATIRRRYSGFRPRG